MSDNNPTSMELAERMLTLSHALRDMKDAVLAPGAVLSGVIFDQFSGEAVEGDAAELLAHAICSIDVVDDSANGSVVRFPGCFEVSANVLAHAALLNAAKDAFKQCVKELEESGLTQHQLRGVYRKLGYSRIHPLQAWRHVNVIDGVDLASIGFSVAKSTEGVEVLTYSQLITRLHEARAQDVISALENRPTYPANVHWHTPVSRHIRANLVWGAGENRRTSMLHASMPFLVLEGGWPAKRVRFNQPRTHKPRSDSQAKNIVPLTFRAGAYISWA